MKKIILLLITILTFNLANSQEYVELSFIKSTPDQSVEYDKILNDKWAKLHQQRINDGYINGWDVWKIIGGINEDRHHTYVIATISDDPMNRKNPGLKSIFPDMTDADVDLFMKNNRASRTIKDAAYTMVVDKYFKSTDSLPNLMTINYMKVAPGNEKAYEDMETITFKSAHENNPNVAGWGLLKRIGRYGSDLYWNYITLDFYANGEDWHNQRNQATQAPNKAYKKIQGLREHVNNETGWKMISLRKE